MDKIQLSDHFDYRRLLRFTFPTIIMMIFSSIYGIVDGLFISNFAGSTPFAAVNLIMPFIMIFSAVGFMIGAGGTALVSMTFGTGDDRRANGIFSLLVYTVILLGITVSIIGEITLPAVTRFLGATGEMYSYCIIYGRISFISLTAFMLQNMFSSFFVTAEKPNLGLAVTLLAGATNIALDALFVGYFRWGVAGAATATVITECVGGLVPLVYFALPNDSILRLGKACMEVRPLIRTCTNGFSEFMTNISMSLVNVIYNFQLLSLAGENGVAAYGIIMYASFIFGSISYGYSMGSAPIVGYHYGAGNHEELSNVLHKSLILTFGFSIIMTLGGVGLAGTIARIFVGYDQALLAMTTTAFALYTTKYIIAGYNIYASSFFTALNNGLVSGIISSSRVLLFQIAAVLILPVFFGLNGIWLSMTLSETCSLMVTIYFFIRCKDRYHYF